MSLDEERNLLNSLSKETNKQKQGEDLYGQQPGSDSDIAKQLIGGDFPSKQKQQKTEGRQRNGLNIQKDIDQVIETELVESKTATQQHNYQNSPYFDQTNPSQTNQFNNKAPNNKASHNNQHQTYRIPTHRIEGSRPPTTSPLAFRTNTSSQLGVSQILASGYSKYLSPRRNPYQLSSESRGGQSSVSNNFADRLRGLNSEEVNQDSNGTINISQIQDTQDTLKTTNVRDNSNQSGRLYQTMIRLDTEIKKMKTESLLRSSGKEATDNLKFNEDQESNINESFMINKSITSSYNLTEEIKEPQDIEQYKKLVSFLRKEIANSKQLKAQASQSRIVYQINKDLAQKQEILTRENNDLQEQLVDQQSLYQILRSDYDTLNDKFEKLEQQYESLKQFSVDENVFLSLKSSQSDLLKQLESQSVLRRQKELEADQLKKDIKEVQERRENISLSQNVNQLNKQIDDLTEQIREFQGEKLGLIDQIEGLQKEVKTITQENRDYEKKINETITLLDEKGEKLQALKSSHEALSKEVIHLRSENASLKQKVTENEERLQIFNVIKSGGEESVLKMNCQIIVRKNIFDKYIVHIESVSEITMLMATDITDLIPSKVPSQNFFQIGIKSNSNRKRFATFEANSRQEMVSICQNLKTFLIKAQNQQSTLSSSNASGSSPARNIRIDPNKDFLSSIASFFGN